MKTEIGFMNTNAEKNNKTIVAMSVAISVSSQAR
jgi:hypothetical protein